MPHQPHLGSNQQQQATASNPTASSLFVQRKQIKGTLSPSKHQNHQLSLINPETLLVYILRVYHKTSIQLSSSQYHQLEKEKMVPFFLFLALNLILMSEAAARKLMHTEANAPTEFELETVRHHKRPFDKSIVFAEVMLGCLAVAAALAIFAYIRVTRKRDDANKV